MIALDSGRHQKISPRHFARLRYHPTPAGYLLMGHLFTKRFKIKTEPINFISIRYQIKPPKNDLIERIQTVNKGFFLYQTAMTAT